MRNTPRSNRATAYPIITVGVSLLLLLLPTPGHAQATDIAIPPGIGLGGSVGPVGVGGTANQGIGNAIGWDVFLTAGLSRGLYVHAGATLSGHELGVVSPSWHQVSAYIEPRYVIQRQGSHWAPFAAARLGRSWEKLSGRGYSFKGTGTSYGAGGGVVHRLAPQISIEGGVIAGATRFDDYTFTGDFAWKTCLDGLSPGTPLPASVTSCNGSRSIGGVLRLCYPPYFPEGSSRCDPPEIPYTGTSRTGTWLRMWVGLRLSFSTKLVN